jgi:ERCC4-related helicase/HKD family nuclease
MTKIIDNSSKKFGSVLRDEIKDAKEVGIASAYFNLEGFRQIKDPLKEKPLKLLLGREPSESIKFEEELLASIESYSQDFEKEQSDVLSSELMRKEDDETYFSIMKDAADYFNKRDVEVKIVKGRFFHGKAYLGASPSLPEIRNGFASVGSSNFTGGGLAGNRELNMLTTDREGIMELSRWFLGLWNDEKSEDFKEQFIKLLENYVTTHSPYEVVAKALYEVYSSQLKEAEGNNQIKSLFQHQVLSFTRASAILREYGGVVIADSTGLGKTRVAINLAMNAVKDGKNPLLIAPKAALETTWEDEMDKTHFHLDSINSERLSSSPELALKNYEDKNFIIVDEAHYFRTPSSNRYEAMQEFVAKGGKEIVLLTATPVNNSLMDLYSLLSLYLGEDAISDVSPSLKGYFSYQQKQWINNRPVDMDNILRKFLVRVSRDLAKALGNGELNFPERRLDDDPRDRYEMNVDFEELADSFDSLSFVYYDYAIEKLSAGFTLPDGTKLSPELVKSRKDFLGKLVKTVVKINFFKRLESSTASFIKTMETLEKYVKGARDAALKRKYFIPPKMKGDLTEMYEDGDSWEPPAPEEFFSERYSSLLDRCKLSDDEVKEFTAKCDSDLSLIKTIIGKLPSNDGKLSQLIARMGNIKLLDKNGIIIFAQYSDTARYIHEKISKVFRNVKLTTGSGSINGDGRETQDRTSVIKDFMKNGGYLVTTDVLSESQNLQNAQYIVNYDFPWNPVVLIQRAGRIDRIGSPYSEVYLINMLPVNGDERDPKSLAHFLSVMKKLYSRIKLIAQTIGIDSSTLGEDASPKDFALQERMGRNDQSVLEVLKEQLEQFTSDPIDQLARMIAEKGEEWLKDIPYGIGAYKQYSRNGMFILFRNGDRFYWNLKFFDGAQEMIQNPNEIIEILLSGQSDTSGETIDYSMMMSRFRQLKESLKEKLKEELKTAVIMKDTKFGSTQKEREISTALKKMGDEGIRLSAVFNTQRTRTSVVNSLYKAYKEGNLLDKARVILHIDNISDNQGTDPVSEVKIEPRRVCWCLLKKSEEPVPSPLAVQQVFSGR